MYTFGIGSYTHTETNIFQNDICVEGEIGILNALNAHFVNIANIIQKTKLVKNNFMNVEQFLNEKLMHNNLDIEFITPFKEKKLIDKLNMKSLRDMIILVQEY